MLERPAIAVLPFDLVGHEARVAAAMAEEIIAALLRLRWFRVATPEHARYHLHGKCRGNGAGHLRVTVVLRDASTGRVLWADHRDGCCDEAFAFEERVATGIARAVEPALRAAEIDRVRASDPTSFNAWELSMRALPGVLSYEAVAEARALELLEQAMEMAPQDPLPFALAAWCRGVRSCLHLVARPQQERDAARGLAAVAARLSHSDALTEAALTSGYTLAHDLTTAAAHADRALALDGGSALAWARAGWVSAFSGDASTAIERFRIARSIAPADPQSAVCCFGIASVPFAAGRMREAIPWIERGLAEHPQSTWIKAFLAAGYALENRKDDARGALATWRRTYPEVTAAQLASGLPFRARLYDRLAEGLKSAGMRVA
jgi:TolB-like protein